MIEYDMSIFILGFVFVVIGNMGLIRMVDNY